MPTLVTGAAGFVGACLVDELLRRGERVRAFVHRQNQAKALEKRGVEVAVGDVRDKDAVVAAVQGARVVHHCAAAVGAGSHDDSDCAAQYARRSG